MTLLSPVTTILPELHGSPMENGDAGRTSLAARAVDQDLLLCGRWRLSANGNGEASASGCSRSWGNYYYASGRAGFCNGEWRMWSSISAQAAWDTGNVHVLLACWGDNAAMETTMEEGNRQINLSSRI